MTIALVMLDYERLAGAELGRATLSETAASRKRHLNRAAVYAHLGLRLIHSQKATAVARATAERKLTASLS